MDSLRSCKVQLGDGQILRREAGGRCSSSDSSTFTISAVQCSAYPEARFSNFQTFSLWCFAVPAALGQGEADREGRTAEVERLTPCPPFQA